jgi:hypothetical protein
MAALAPRRSNCKRTMHMRCILLAVLFLGSFCGHALAWGDTAHQVICEVAFRLAKPATQTEIQRLINSDPTTKFPDFSESCVLPDHPRIRASEHFLNLPRDSAGLTSDNCPGAKMRPDRHSERSRYPRFQERDGCQQTACIGIPGGALGFEAAWREILSALTEANFQFHIEAKLDDETGGFFGSICSKVLAIFLGDITVATANRLQWRTFRGFRL